MVESKKKSYATIAQTQTVLLRYVLPGMGFPPPKGRKITELEKQTGFENLKQIRLDQIQELSETVNCLLVNVGLSKSNQRTQRHTLNRFISWCKAQPWWATSISHNSVNKVEGQVKTKQPRSTIRKQKPYGLRATIGKRISTQLQQELNEFYEFRINPPAAVAISAVKTETAKGDLKNIDLFLGWLHHYKMTPIEQLTLHKFIPSPIRNRYETVEKGDRFILEIFGYIREYIDWLKSPTSQEDSENRGKRSHYTVINIIRTSLAVIRFLYYKHPQHFLERNYEDLREVRALRQEARKLQQTALSKIPTTSNNETSDWLEFLQLVETLRLECEPDLLVSTQNDKNRRRSSRSLSAISLSLQRFLMVAFYAYLPLRSRITYRYLHFFTSNSSAEVIDYLTFQKGYLFFYDNVWWIKLFGPLSSSNEDERPPILKVPDLSYSDSTTFYNYLNLWLIHYPSSDGETEQGGLREVFHPKHSLVFTQKNGQPYKNATDFTNVIRNASHRILGKALTPNTIRRMFASYMQSHGYSEALINSLTSSINCNRDDLQKFYSEQGNDAILELVQKFSKSD